MIATEQLAETLAAHDFTMRGHFFWMDEFSVQALVRTFGMVETNWQCGMGAQMFSVILITMTSVRF